MSWNDTRTGEGRIAQGFDELVELWTYGMSLILNPQDIIVRTEFNERDRTVLCYYEWPDSNFLHGSHVLIFDEDFNIVRSNVMNTSKPGVIEEHVMRMYSHWNKGDFNAFLPYYHPDIVVTMHNMRNRVTTQFVGPEACHNCYMEENRKITDKSDFQIVDMKFLEKTRQAMLVCKCPASGIHYWSGTYTYDEDLKLLSVVSMMNRDW